MEKVKVSGMFGKHVHDVMLRYDFNNFVSVKNKNFAAKMDIFNGKKLFFDSIVQACYLAQPLNQCSGVESNISLQNGMVNSSEYSK